MKIDSFLDSRQFSICKHKAQCNKISINRFQRLLLLWAIKSRYFVDSSVYSGFRRVFYAIQLLYKSLSIMFISLYDEIPSSPMQHARPFTIFMVTYKVKFTRFNQCMTDRYHNSTTKQCISDR